MTDVVVYTSPFVPPEWIAAHGFVPERRIPGTVHDVRPGACPFASSYAADMSGVAGRYRASVFTTTCDQMRRGAEAAGDGEVFVLNVPHTWGAASHRLYADELRRLGRFLVRLGGREPGREELVDALRSYDAGRRRLREARGFLSGRAWAEAAGAHFASGAPGFTPPAGPGPGGGAPLALLGVPVWGTHANVYSWIEEAGGEVVLDGTETGERGLPAKFDLRRIEEDPVLELADAYFGGIPDAFRRPNSELYRWLGEEIAARDVRGILLLRCTWCDLWHAERARLTEWSPVPVVELDLTAESNGRARAETRIQALLDMVR